MDDSQSSDIFSGNEENACNTFQKMDTTNYKSLLSKLKSSLSKNVQKRPTSSFYTCFTSVLEDCDTCISQCLDLIASLLNKTDVEVTKLREYMEDAVCLLQMMSHFIKIVVESMTMTCCTMKYFPTSVGQVILVVFIHCQESESLYGNNLRDVEKQLKELFRTCHELQLSYLMIMEKHFIFDLTEMVELNILLEALDINLKIGKIVQSLDVKTMAEQWKAYTMLCEKYCTYLKRTDIYQDSTKVLSLMIENQVKMAVEANQDDKVVLRSLKIANFTIKILLKICTIFKDTTMKSYDHMTGLIVYVHMNNSSYSESINKRSTEFTNAVNNNILLPNAALLKNLLLDKTFSTELMLKIEQSRDDAAGLYVIISIIQIILDNGQAFYNLPLQSLIDAVFKLLPNGHIWFNIDLKLDIVLNSHKMCGLYEHLLTHTVALAATFNSDQMKHLEEKMYEAILGIDCISALFASNLWILLARFSNRQYLLSQVLSLCHSYQKLDKNILFATSPQQVHLKYTLCKLFQSLPNNDDKMSVYTQFSLQNEKNTTLWTVLRVKNLPDAAQRDAEKFITEKLVKYFDKLLVSRTLQFDEMYNLITTMKLSPKFSVTSEKSLEDKVVNVWVKLCPTSNKFLPRCEIDTDYLWYIDLVEALVSLTNCIDVIWQSSSNLVRILHVITDMIRNGNIELKLAVINIMFKISLVPVLDDNKNPRDSLSKEIFKILLEETDFIVKNIFLNSLRRYKSNRYVQNIVCQVVDENTNLQETWNIFMKQLAQIDEIDVKQELIATLDLQFKHKCIENTVAELSRESSQRLTVKTNSNNFDLADIDSLFEADSDSEPACKKVKVNNNDIEDILIRLENDVSLLIDAKENVSSPEYLNRIKVVCEKLKNITGDK